jgi:prepilin-type N-terminal cleavage/methylation domain-containing protein
MKKTDKNAFTLIEILVACAVVALFVGTVISLFVNFRRSYSKSESSAILLQETALFLARLRNDMNNAVIDPAAADAGLQFDATADQLSFKVYDNRSGKIYPVVYRVLGDNEKRDLLRRLGNENEKPIVRNNVASISWETEIERFAGPASGTIRVCLNLKVTLKNVRGSEKPFEIKTRIFPARLNRQLNN